MRNLCFVVNPKECRANVQPFIFPRTTNGEVEVRMGDDVDLLSDTFMTVDEAVEWTESWLVAHPGAPYE
jgi:hypothetical protein